MIRELRLGGTSILHVQTLGPCQPAAPSSLTHALGSNSEGTMTATIDVHAHPSTPKARAWECTPSTYVSEDIGAGPVAPTLLTQQQCAPGLSG